MNDLDLKIIERLEHVRRTGFDGRKPLIAKLPRALGEKLVVLNQIESAASYGSVFWIDSNDPLFDVWDFSRTTLFAPLKACLDYYEKQSWNDEQALHPKTPADELYWQQWSKIRKLVHKLDDDKESAKNYGVTVVTLLFAVMILRQWTDATFVATTKNLAEVQFTTQTNNCASSFIALLCSRLGNVPFDANDGAPIDRLALRVASY